MEDAKRKSLIKPLIAMIIFLILVFGGIFGFGLMRSIFTQRYFANFQPPPPVISTTQALAKTWQPTIQAVGSLVAINGVQVTPEIPGMVVKIYFQSGQLVQQNQPLIKLDDSTDQQDLKSFQAQLTLGQISYHRQSILYKTGSAAAAALDQARATLQENEANVKRTEVIIDKKTIKAPFTGKIGIRQVNLGEYVAAGTPLVSLQSLDPLYVNFSLPEQYLKILTLNQSLQITVAAHGNQIFTGKITAINSQVDAQNRNILVQGTIPNAQYLLYPGMFTNVNVVLPQQQNVITVPQTAITYSLYGDSIYVVKEAGKDKNGKPILKAQIKYITIGDRQGNEVAITKGIAAGENVVTSGQVKLHDGSVVIINNTNNLQSAPVTNDTNGSY